MRHAFAFWIAVILCSLPMVATADMGPLSEYLPADGSAGVWTGSHENGDYRLVNRTDPNAITYFYTDAGTGPGSRRRISVSVRFAGSDDSALAGLVYGYDPKDHSYFLFILKPGKRASLIRRDADGFNPLLESTLGSITEGANSLTIEETDEGIALSVNGKQMATIGTPGVGKGGVGIVAGGRVDASFADFAIDGPRPRAKTSPQPAGAAQPARMAQATAPAPTSTAGAGPGHVRLRPVQIVDSQGPFGAVSAYSALVPANWKTEGGVVWNDANGCRKGPQLVWSADSPDLAWGVDLLPVLSWSVSTNGTQIGCLKADITDARTAAGLYAKINPQANLQPTGFRRLPELDPIVQQMARGLAQAPGARNWLDSGLMTATYTGTDGKQHGMHMLIITVHSEQSYAAFGFPGGIRFGSVGIAVAVTTPPDFQGEDFPPEVVAVLQNIRENPQWAAAVQGWWRQQTAALGAASRKSAADSAAILDSSMQSWRRKGAMEDAGQSKVLSGLWETEKYGDSSGRTYDLDMHYGHAWKLDDGSIVQTNDANFNPMQVLGETGSEMQPLR